MTPAPATISCPKQITALSSTTQSLDQLPICPSALLPFCPNAQLPKYANRQMNMNDEIRGQEDKCANYPLRKWAKEQESKSAIGQINI
jgi:hypothetical protein